MSTYGRAVTEKLANDLANAGIVIVSGLALGVDSAAHTWPYRQMYQRLLSCGWARCNSPNQPFWIGAANFTTGWGACQ